MSIEFLTPSAIDFKHSVDKHARAKTAALGRLRALLDVNDVQAGGRLPPERTLAEQFGVSRRAVRYALDLLEAEGRISRQQGRGTLICDARAGTHDLCRNSPRSPIRSTRWKSAWRSSRSSRGSRRYAQRKPTSTSCSSRRRQAGRHPIQILTRRPTPSSTAGSPSPRATR